MAGSRDPNAVSDRPALERELTRLKRQHAEMAKALDLANERVQELESARDQALDRIEWAIDSLHNVRDHGQ